MKNTLFFLMIILSFCLISCEKNDTALDKKISLILIDDKSYSNFDADTVILFSSILDFNITDYKNINSAYLVISNVETFDWNGDQEVNLEKEIKVELYDLTNAQVILNSQIITDDIISSTSKRSNNFVDDLPESSINLGLLITKTTHDNYRYYFKSATLELMRE